jgi:D-ribulokinase
MADAPRWIGIDIGTQGVRATVLSEAAEIVGSGAAPLEGRRSEGRHEQSAEAWWTAVRQALGFALSGLRRDTIEALAIAATSGTIVLVDAAGRPMSPGVMYDDTRGAPYVDAVNAAGAAQWQAMGYARMQPAWALPKLLSLFREPGLGGGFRMLHQADYVAERLAGRPVATDTSQALKTGCDLDRLAWPADIFDALGIDRGWLPPLVTPGAIIGQVAPPVAEDLDLPAGVAIMAGMTDSCAAQLGAGAVALGAWNSVLGTTLALKGVSAHRVTDPAGVLYSHRGLDGQWLPGGASSSGAGIVAARLRGRDLALLDAPAAAALSPGLFTYPLAGRGERFPFVEPGAAAFSSREPAGDAEALAAIMMGLAYVERLCFEMVEGLGLPVEGEITMTGGATANRHWTQLRADVLGREAIVPAQSGAALGMALLAGAAVSDESLASLSARCRRQRTRFAPAQSRASELDEGYQAFLHALAARGWLPQQVSNR